MTALDNRPACNYPGDVSGMVGQVVGPTLAGELLVADAVVYDEQADRSRVTFRYATVDEAGGLFAALTQG